MNTNWVTGLIAVALIGVGAILLTKSNAPLTVNVQPPQNQSFGAVSGPDIYSPYLNINGVTKFYSKIPFNQASTTLCSIPVTATSTIIRLNANFVSGNAYSNTFLFGIGTDRYSTTTAIGTPWTISGKYGTILASSTQQTGSEVLIPGQYVNFKVSTSTASLTYLPVGNCAMESQAL